MIRLALIFLATQVALADAQARADLTSMPLADLTGAKHQLSDWKGQVVIVNFWASWCSTCQYEIPDLARWQKDFSAQGLQVVGIGLDEQRKLANVARSLEINYPVLVMEPAAGTLLLKDWGNQAGVVPYTLVIDRQGKVAYFHLGQFGWPEFRQQVMPLLANKS